MLTLFISSRKEFRTLYKQGESIEAYVKFGHAFMNLGRYD
jgi:hypothetical protein